MTSYITKAQGIKIRHYLTKIALCAYYYNLYFVRLLKYVCSKYGCLDESWKSHLNALKGVEMVLWCGNAPNSLQRNF